MERRYGGSREAIGKGSGGIRRRTAVPPCRPYIPSMRATPPKSSSRLEIPAYHLRGLTGPHVRRTMSSYDRQLGLEAEVMTRATDVPLPVTITRRPVTSATRLRIILAPGGGQAIRIRPAR